MAKEIFFNAARSKAIEDNAIDGGFVDTNGKLILKRHNGVEFEAGDVKGPKGDDARYPLPNVSGVKSYIRLATLDGLNNSTGANYSAILSGLGSPTLPRRTSVTFHATQRAADIFDLKAWAHDLTPDTKIYSRKLGPYFYEVWLSNPPWQINAALIEIASWNALRNLDSLTTSPPSNLSEIQIQDSDQGIANSPNVALVGDGSSGAPVSLRVRALDDPALPVGTLENSFRGGFAKVKIDGVLSSVPYEWASPYDPSGSRQVRLMRTSSGFVIAGQCEPNIGLIALNLSLFRNYGEFNAGSWASTPKAIKLPSGLITLNGMLASISAPPDGSVIGTLPPGFRPDYRVLLAVQMNNGARTVSIQPNGVISVYGGAWPSGWLSLDGLSFWSPNTAQWTNIGDGGSSWGSPFIRNSSWANEYGEPGFWKDPYGFVWFRGLAQLSAAVSADGTTIINLPSSHRATIREHHRTTGNSGYAGIEANSSGLGWKLNSPGSAGSHISLNGVMVRTADADNLNYWYPVQPRTNNGWNKYGESDLTSPSYGLREDGLRFLYGMVSGGTVGQQAGGIFFFQDYEFNPRMVRKTFGTIASNAAARVTIWPSSTDGDNARNSVYSEAGSNTWFSLDGLHYHP